MTDRVTALCKGFRTASRSTVEIFDYGADVEGLQRRASAGGDGAVGALGFCLPRAPRMSLSSSSSLRRAMVSDGDEDLMRLVAAGDEAAFRRLADRHLARMVRLAEKTLGRSAEADDVAQDALIRIWNNAATWRPDRAKLTTWIYTIVYRLCLDRLRKPRTTPLDDAMQIEDPAASALERMGDEEELRRLRVAIQTLEPRQRAALTLFYYEDCPGVEAAAVLGVGLRAFWSLLHRARQNLQNEMRSPAG